MTLQLPLAWHSLHPQLERLPSKLQQLLVECYEAAQELVTARGYAAIPSEVAWFCPVTAVADPLEVKHNTVSTWFKRYPVLKQVLIYSPYVGNIWDARLQGTKRWHAGAVWVIRLGSPKGLSMRDEYLKHPWRDLQADIKLKNTLRQSSDVPQESVKQTIHYWSPVLSPIQTPLELDCRNTPEQVIPAVSGASSIAAVAALITQWLGDRHEACWRRVLWTVYRSNRLAHFTDMVSRVLVDIREWPDLRNPAALLVTRCRHAGYLA